MKNLSYLQLLELYRTAAKYISKDTAFLRLLKEEIIKRDQANR